jgi:HEAT repeat protein
MRLVKYSRQKFCAALTVAFVSLSSPLALTTSSWAQTSTDTQTQIPHLIRKLKSNDEWEWIEASQTLGSIGQPAVPDLIKALKDPNWQVRLGAACALGNIGQPAVRELSKALKDSDTRVRRVAAFGLQTMGKAAKAAMPQLIDALQDPDIVVRRNAAQTLKNIGKAAKAAVPQLIDALQNSNEDKMLRRYAAWALGEIASEAKVAVPQLTDALKDPDAVVRQNAAYALGNIGAEAKASVPELIAALQEPYQKPEVRRNVAGALGKLGKLDVLAKDSKENIVIALSAALKKDEDTEVRRRAANALGSIGLAAKAAVPQLTDALQDSDQNVRNTAIAALGSIAFTLQEKANTLSPSDLVQTIMDLEKALKKLEDSKLKLPKEFIAVVRLPLESLTTRLLIDSISKNPWVWGVGIYLVSLLGIFWIRPLWLLKIDEFLKPFSFKVPNLGTEISPRFLLFLKYHPRVLDAWVATHVKSVREEFQAKNTVRDREIYIPIPVILNGQAVAQLTGKDLCLTFNKHLLIWGEGGAGKTSLACQIAKWAMSDDETDRLCHHRMLPVLIEDELQSATNQQPLIAAIQGHLQDLSGETESISEELLEKLLRQRRILVIVDHLSEMSEETRKAVHPEMPNFPVNALIVTSRIEESLGHITKTTIRPLRVEGNRLSSFIEAYLIKRNKRDLFTDPEFFNACSRLSLMVGEKRNVTALFAKLYTEQLIAAKIETSQEYPLQLPDNIPDLMLAYLNELNRGVPEKDRLDDRIIHYDVEAIAWECLKGNYRPSVASREDAIAALGREDAESHFKYLENRLRLIQTIGPAQVQIRFTLDPLAEYFAGLYLVEQYGNNEQLWHQFLEKVAAVPGDPKSIKGFLLVVQDCCLTKGRNAKVPEFLANKLSQLS